MKRNKRTYRIGLTGGVGCGKSFVMDVLQKEYGVLALVADDIGRMAMEKGTATYEEIVRCFGEGVLDGEGNVRRDKVAEIIFSDEDKKKKQNDIIHPFVMDYILGEIERTDKALAVIESAILVQAGYEDVCDEIWLVLSKDKMRRERLKLGRGYTDERIDAIMKNQWTDAEYLRHCDKVIHNEGNVAEVREQIRKLIPRGN